MLSDLRLALRTLAKSPGFTAIAVLTLALGIGLSTSAFSLTNVLLFRNLPYPQSEELVRVFRTAPQAQRWNHHPGNALDIRAAATTFSSVALYSFDSLAYAESDEPAIQITGLNVAPNFFATLGVAPALGRLFAPDEDQPGRSNVAVLTHRMWTRRFGADPAILGRSVRINGETHTIVGVLPTTFEAPLVWGPTELLRPLTIHPHYPTTRNGGWMQIIGRRKPGVPLAQIQGELSTIASRLAREYPKENASDGLRAVDLKSANMDSVSRAILWMMPVLSTLVLVIACANLASLLLARAFGRSREFAIRSALGASRSHLMRPLLSESFLLAVAGGIVGLLFAAWGANLLGRNLQINNEYGLDIPLDGRVLAFAVVSAVLSGFAFGLAPAWLAARTPAADSLKDGSRGSTAGRSHHRLKYALIAGELAFALVLVGVAGSFALGSRAFLRRELGWSPDGVYSGYLVTPWNRYGDNDKLRTFHRDLLERLAAIPGVDHASITTGLPIFSFFGNTNVVAEGHTVPEGQEPLAMEASVSADYFAVAKIPLLRGAAFPADLRSDSRPMVIVNDSLARRFWPGEDAVGKRVKLKGLDTLAEVMGVVGDVRLAANLCQPDTPLQLYRPLVQNPPRYQLIALRSSVPPETLTPSVRRAVAALDPDLPVANPGSVREGVRQGLANINVVIANLAIFAAMGLLIAVIGLYGVIANLTAQRTRDIGVRIALGAGYRDIVTMVLRQGLILFALGMALGLPLFLAARVFLSRAMASMPFPGLWLPLATLAVLGVATLVACWLPARRAARVDPLIALQAD